MERDNEYTDRGDENDRRISPEEELFQRPSRDMDLGYESGGWTQEPDEPVAFTTLEMEELTKFAHIHEQIDLVEAHIDDKLGWFMHKEEGVPPKKENLIFILDSQLNWYLHIVAFHLYEQFSKEVHMREAANFMLGARHADKKVAEEFEIRDLGLMWDQS